MAMSLPGDLLDWLDQLGLQRRKAILKKSLIHGFVDGVFIIEIFQATYPRFGFGGTIEETLNTEGRLKNWQLLNSKVLKVISMEIPQSDMRCISKKDIDAVACISFLRLFRTKLGAYHPIYMEQQRVLVAKQRTLSATNPPPPPSSPSISSNSKPRRSPSTSSSVAPPPKPTLSRTTKTILHQLKSREAVRAVAARLTEDDMERMYKEVTSRCTTTIVAMMQESDEQQKRSMNMDATLAALRDQNLQDMAKAEKKLSHLHLELNALSAGSSYVVDPDEEAHTVSGSTKSSHLTRKILTDLHVRGLGRRNFPVERKMAMEARIGRKSSLILSRLGLPVPSDYVKSTTNQLEAPSALADMNDDALLAMDDADMDRHVYASITGGLPEKSAAPRRSASPEARSRSSAGDLGRASSPGRSPDRIRVPLSATYAGGISSNSISASLGSSSQVVNSKATASSPAPSPAPIPASSLAPSPTPRISALTSKILTHFPADVVTSAPALTHTHRRVYDEEHKRHFYVHEQARTSSWYLPEEGIVSCVDERTGSVFFINAATRATAWKLEDL